MLISAGVALLLVSAVAGDLDRDGLSDELEQRLLDQFAPRFFISPKECDVAPAAFRAGSVTPEPTSLPVTIYGQAFPVAAGIELHYYHLWRRDCGPRGHALDVEHVAVLLSSAGSGRYTARYWFAAAHENTVCDLSHGARARDLAAESKGPDVWISRGKHSSFLGRTLCGTGCGADICDGSKPLAVSRIVNVGEPGRALNGALWIDSPEWPFASKMQTSFAHDTLTAIDNAPEGKVILVASHPRGSQRTLAVATTTLDSTTGAAAAGRDHTGRSLRRVWKATSDFLTRKK